MRGRSLIEGATCSSRSDSSSSSCLELASGGECIHSNGIPDVVPDFPTPLSNQRLNMDYYLVLLRIAFGFRFRTTLGDLLAQPTRLAGGQQGEPENEVGAT